MRLSFEHGKLYVDNVKFSKYEAQHGTELRPGVHQTEARYSHNFGKVLPHLDGLGWLGADAGVQIVLGSVRSQSSLIPDGHLVRVLVEKIEAAHDLGDTVLSEVA